MATCALCFSQPPRTAHPMVQFSCQPCEPMVIENIPFDKYELEPSPLTQYILERRQPNTCWQVCTPPHQYTPMLAGRSVHLPISTPQCLLAGLYTSPSVHPNACWQVCTPPHQYTPMLAGRSVHLPISTPQCLLAGLYTSPSVHPNAC